MPKKYLYALIYLFFIGLLLFYSVIYFKNKSNVIEDNYTTFSRIKDKKQINAEYVEYIKETIEYFSLDSGYFKPDNNVSRLEAIQILNKIGYNFINGYGDISKEFPNFEDIKSQDSNIKEIHVFTTFLNKQTKRPNYNKVLGSQFRKNQQISNTEFILLLSYYLNDADIKKKNSIEFEEFSKELNLAMYYKVVSLDDINNKEKMLTRKDCAKYIYNLKKLT